ncbi:ISNCY family transposase [Paenibacillus sp.]|uniref:ISNCY family transposase n=1 Tax=Paenibacillus sp. TaxID=58172 RepID=UPI002D33760F|nr:ISNCY family transposase [Paenibacillus sp.]HZG88298.1 ISNCY family transposase [Paenibacillus sp.]
MLKIENNQLTLWDALLPEPLRKLPEELAIIDELLDNPAFLSPFIEAHPSRRGRPTVPAETYLRLMYLKHRYNLGYETLVQEVSDSLTWRRFCRIDLDAKVPDSTTLIKARKRYGEAMTEALNGSLLQVLREKQVLRTRKLRTDTTVIESDIHHPTDATLLQDGVSVMNRLMKQVRKVASQAAQGFEDKSQEMKRKILSIAKLLRRRTQQSWEDLNAITGDVADLAESVCTQVEHAAEAIKDKGKAASSALKGKLIEAASLTRKLVAQARQVVSGNRIIPERIVSFFDPEARPIKKGKLGKAAEFGYKVRIDETESGFVTGYELYAGNPSDDNLLEPAIEQHIARFGQAPHAVATDRGFASAANEKAAETLGVARISMPTRGKKSKRRTEHEKQHWFQNLQRYRAAGEAKISLLKRKYGLSRSRYRGLAGSKTWVGFGIWVHNLRKATQMTK